MTTLTWIICIPFLAAAVIAAMPRSFGFAIRLLALGATLLTLLCGLIMFCRFDGSAGGNPYQFETFIPWVETVGINFHTGVDGLNVGLVFMGTVVAFTAAAAAWEIRERQKEFYFLLMIMAGGILGSFASLDLFFFFFFHELALIPTFIMIGVWGRGADRNYATFKITLYLSLGALVSLVGLIALYVQSGARSFDLAQISDQLRRQPLGPATQDWIFGLLLFGFGILVSLWPFHTWAPLGYGAAPTPTAMLHAGVLKKFGLYGLIRIGLPFLPEGARHWASVLALLCLGNILFVGLVAMRQKNLNLLIGHSSVAHMGFIFLGIASLTLLGVTGAIFLMVAHGFLAALSFASSGYLYQQTGTVEMRTMGGLARPLPFIGTALAMAMFAGCGLPGFANFVGEIMIFFGAWKMSAWITGLAVWGGLVIGAVYMLRAARNILHGPVAEVWAKASDATGPWRRLPFVLLLASLFVFGFFPRLLTDRIEKSAAPMFQSRSAANNPESRPSAAELARILD